MNDVREKEGEDDGGLVLEEEGKFFLQEMEDGCHGGKWCVVKSE